MKKIWIFTLTLCTLFLLLGLLPVHGEAELYDNVVRLHVIANSDSEADQALKLKVRDAVLSAGKELFQACRTREEAIQMIEANRDLLQEAARATVAQEGFDYPVSLSLGLEEYPTKRYDAVCFPSGEYLSLQVVIGEGDGQNWWCVLFPPLCLSAVTAENTEDTLTVPLGFSQEQYRLITESDRPTYTVRFKILEAFQEFTN